MNILYITKLSGELWKGPNNSVPAQISAQSKMDNVKWYNLTNKRVGMWKKLPYYCDLNDFETKKISKFSPPFNSPDLVVFESAYDFPFLNMFSELQKLRIPYIIIPRCELTQNAQKRKAFKKWLGNRVYFNKIIKKACAIQFLTEKEYQDSGERWNNNSFIVPNGVNSKKLIKPSLNKKSLTGIYIGRLEIYQKGLDLMMDAIKVVKEELRDNNCKIFLYGPNYENTVEKINNIIRLNQIEDIIQIKNAIFDEEKKEKLITSDFFIMTSRFEGHPMGLIEALSYGLPCVITEGTNMTDVVSNYDAGWIAKNDIESISNAIRSLLNERKLINTKGKAAVKVADKYNWDNLAKKSHNKYKELIDNWNGRNL